MRRRIIASVALGTALLLGVGFAPAAQAKAVRSNSGRAVHAARVVHPAARVMPHSFKPYATPVADYVNKTCNIDLSSIADGTTLTSVSGCGVTVTFSVPMEKLSVPDSWATWGSPPNTESATPNVLYTDGATDVVLTYSNTNRRVGVEAEPDLFQVDTMQATFRNAKGKATGVITQDVNGSGGALLFAGKNAKKKAKWSKTVEVTDLSGDDFAIAHIRVS